MRTAFFSTEEIKPEWAKEGDCLFVLRNTVFSVNHIHHIYRFENNSWILDDEYWCGKVDIIKNIHWGFSVDRYTEEKWLTVIYFKQEEWHKSHIYFKGYGFDLRIEFPYNYENKNEYLNIDLFKALEKIKNLIGGNYE